MQDCVRAKSFAKHPSKIHHHPATNMILPDFHLMNPDPALSLFQPHLSVLVSKSMPHDHAYDLLNAYVSKDTKYSSDRKPFVSVWEFISTWFGLPSRDSPVDEEDDASSNKFSPGTRVRTTVGEGQIVSVAQHEVLRYLVKFTFGTGYILPNAIIESLPASDSDTNTIYDADVSQLMPDDIQVLFCTEKIYLFMRLYILLVTMLYQAKDIVERKSEVSDKQDLFSELVSSLKDLLLEQINDKDFEDECKKCMGDDVYNFIAIPPLVEKCAEALIKISKEDCLQHLYHCSQLKLKVCVFLKQVCFHNGIFSFMYLKQLLFDPYVQDLKQQRTFSLDITEDAVYRLQIQLSASQVFFSYLPADMELQLTNPLDVNSSAPTAKGSLEAEKRPLARNVEPEQKRIKIETDNKHST